VKRLARQRLALPAGALRIIDAKRTRNWRATRQHCCTGRQHVGPHRVAGLGRQDAQPRRRPERPERLRQTLKKNGYGYEVTREEKTGDSGRMTFFVAAKPGGKESLLGFFFADDKVLMLTWGETTPKGANVPSAKPDAAKAPSAAEQKKLDDALDVAVEEGTADEVKALIAKGARANRRTNDGKGQTLVQRAVVRRSQEKLALLLQAGADPNAGSDDMLPLTTAALTGQSDILELLLDKGANVNAANPETGRTALHQAAIVGNTDIVQRLLRRGADPARADKSGQTPRQIAEAMKQTAVAELLSEAEAKKD
jgi:ankyrin repeat protein